MVTGKAWRVEARVAALFVQNATAKKLTLSLNLLISVSHTGYILRIEGLNSFSSW
jgi:hypothetical protein